MGTAFAAGWQAVRMLLLQAAHLGQWQSALTPACSKSLPVNLISIAIPDNHSIHKSGAMQNSRSRPHPFGCCQSFDCSSTAHLGEVQLAQDHHPAPQAAGEMTGRAVSWCLQQCLSSTAILTFSVLQKGSAVQQQDSPWSTSKSFFNFFSKASAERVM